MASEPSDAVDCRSPEGVIVGLIDGMIASARVVAAHLRQEPAAGEHVREALLDIRSDDDVALVTLSRNSGAEFVPGPKSDTPLRVSAADAASVYAAEQGIDWNALVDLVRSAMASGFVCIAEQARAGEIDPAALMTDALGDFPTEFLRYRPNLVSDLHAASSTTDPNGARS